MEEFKIIKKRATPYVETIRCDCCDAELKEEPMVSLSNPPIFHYACPNCGKKFTSHRSYPRTVYIIEE